MRVVVGLDLSLCSPGLAMYCCGGQRTSWTLACIAQRKREHKLDAVSLSDNVTLMVKPPLTGTETSDVVRYLHIENVLKTLMSTPVANGHVVTDDDDVTFVIENYAYAAANQGHSYKLHELGGVIKTYIHRCWPKATVVILSPGTWKKFFVGNGHATKHNVLTSVNALFGGIDIMHVFGLAMGPNDAVPTPVQDLCDAVGLVQAVTMPLTITKNRKRKVVSNE